MNIAITGRNVELDDSLKNYIHKRLDNLPHLYKRINNCEVILNEEKEKKNVEIILHLKKTRVVAKGSSLDIYASVDNATEKVRNQLRKLNDKLSSRRAKSIFSIFRGRPEEPDVAKKSGGEIIKANFFADKPMLPDEASLELDLLKRNFIMFKNADTGEVNVIYKRSDGDYGLIEPNF